MYTFTDRSDRSLTLRPEGTAPIARAYVEHGLHREPQPVKLYTIAPMYRYGAPGRGRYREHWQLSVEAIGSADPAIDAEVIQFYARAPAPARRHRVGAAPELDRRRRLPAGVRRAAERVARRAPRRARRGRAPQARDEPAAGLRREEPGACARRSRTRRRSASRSATTAASTSTRCAALPRRATASRTTLDPTLVRGLDYYTRTTFEFVGPGGERQLDDLRRRPLRRPRRGDRRPADAGDRLRRRDRAAAARARARRRRRRAAARSTSSSSSTAAPREQVLPLMAELRRARHRLRHRLRRPLAQGPAHAGRPHRRARRS